VQLEKATEHFKSLNEEATIITSQKLNHPGGCYGLRIERNGKVLVICTDVEHGDQIDPLVVKLAQGADLLVHDAQYTSEELPQQRGWGHSSYDQAMQVAARRRGGDIFMTLTRRRVFIAAEKLCQERFGGVVAREGTSSNCNRLKALVQRHDQSI
jgi:ribonuclease BN (tRNA processing enzyme)